MSEEPAPEGATWVVRDAEGRVIRYSTEPIVLEMTAQLGEALNMEAVDGGDRQRDDQ